MQTDKRWDGMLELPIVLAGAMGAGGVILAAVSAHLPQGAGLESAAYMLLFHAAAILGVAAILRQGLLWRPLAGLALAAWIWVVLCFLATSRFGLLRATAFSRWRRRAAAPSS